MGDTPDVQKDVTEDDIGKPIFTAEEHKIGTLRGTLLRNVANSSR